jgi:hypothetical protein
MGRAKAKKNKKKKHKEGKLTLWFIILTINQNNKII